MLVSQVGALKTEQLESSSLQETCCNDESCCPLPVLPFPCCPSFAGFNLASLIYRTAQITDPQFSLDSHTLIWGSSLYCINAYIKKPPQSALVALSGLDSSRKY